MAKKRTWVIMRHGTEPELEIQAHFMVYDTIYTQSFAFYNIIDGRKDFVAVFRKCEVYETGSAKLVNLDRQIRKIKRMKKDKEDSE